MLKYMLPLVVFVHGMIHFLGVANAFGYGNAFQHTRQMPRSMGVLWLLAALLFLATTVFYFIKKDNWPYIAILSTILSQILIIAFWKDAKYGTIVNTMVLLAAMAAVASQHFERQFKRDVEANLHQTVPAPGDLLTESDMQTLPEPVQNYLRYSGAINRPKLKNARIVFRGEMRDKEKDWFTFQSVQYNFFDDPTRLFFMKAKIYNLQVPGYHDYQNGFARMDVRLFGLFSMASAKGKEMNQAETVTVFNDMCLMFPSSLIDKRIQWEAIDKITTKATFTNGATRISATLYFNEIGQLTNFISDDRFVINERKQYRFSTPVTNYKLFNGRNVPTYGEAIWHYPEGEFIYGKFYLRSIEYNVADFRSIED